jgi:hypothetical protein
MSGSILTLYSVEILFWKEYLKVVIATETLALGINVLFSFIFLHSNFNQLSCRCLAKQLSSAVTAFFSQPSTSAKAQVKQAAAASISLETLSSMGSSLKRQQAF